MTARIGKPTKRGRRNRGFDQVPFLSKDVRGCKSACPLGPAHSTSSRSIKFDKLKSAIKSEKSILVFPPFQTGDSVKLKTHSGAKKRFRAKPSGKIKHKQPNLRHILTKKSSKRKRHLGQMAYVCSSNEYQLQRQLVL